MSAKAQRITGWVMSVIFGAFMIVGSGSGKFFDFTGKAEMMEKLQIPVSLLPTVGVIEITVVALFLIPRTGFLGAILTTAYLGGALWTHLRVSDTWFFPIIMGVWMWVALGLRHPVIFKLAFGQSADPKPTSV
ncbi:MAG: DoxX family protein [Planctomycetaceae bacterium]